MAEVVLMVSKFVTLLVELVVCLDARRATELALAPTRELWRGSGGAAPRENFRLFGLLKCPETHFLLWFTLKPPILNIQKFAIFTYNLLILIL